VVDVFLATVFLDGTFEIAVFLTAGFGTAFLDVAVFLGLSDVSLEIVFLEFSLAGFFTALAAVVFFGFSPIEDGFFVVATLLLVEATGFLFSRVRTHLTDRDIGSTHLLCSGGGTLV